MDQLGLQRIKALPLFSDLEDETAARLLDDAIVKSFASDTLLFSAGNPAEHLHVVLRGIVELYSGEHPGECTLLLMAKGDLFMPAAALFDEPYLNSARTLTSASLVLIPAATARGELARSTRFALNVTRALAGHFRMAVRNIIDLRSCSAPVRLGRFLLRLVQIADGETVSLPAPKGKLAARVGMSRETFSRALQTLADEGLVVRGSQIIVRDRCRIERFCATRDVVRAGARGLDVHAI
jgi:CRP/FNR family transcriptional regulator, transcriptional activator FtrB